MQICTIAPPDAPQETMQSFFELYAKFAETYPNVSILEIDHQHFIVKALGRKDYREIMLNQDLDVFLKEEAVCEICCLYPEAFDFENCDAGLPSKLYEDIIRFSFLDNAQEEERIQLMHYFRNEMIELHNQINCLISEAFPSLNFDEIENFDMATALKYLSRAEWILQNLRGFEMYTDPFTGKEWSPEQVGAQAEDVAFTSEKATPTPTQEQVSSLKQPKVAPPGFEASQGFVPGETIDERVARLQRGELKKEQLTPQKLAQLESQFPEIDWRQQVQAQDLENNVDTTPVALRTPDQLYKR